MTFVTAALITAILLILCISMLAAAVIMRKWKIALYAIIPFLLFVASAVISAGLIVKKSYDVVKNTRPDTLLKKREGSVIYEAIFSKPDTACVNVLNSKDQYIPGLDCCIWLQFTTCPQEMRRLLKEEKYTARVLPSGNLQLNFSERPDWWQPEALGDSVILFQHDLSGRRMRSFVSSIDSTHILYCDMLY